MLLTRYDACGFEQIVQNNLTFQVSQLFPIHRGEDLFLGVDLQEEDVDEFQLIFWNDKKQIIDFNINFKNLIILKKPNHYKFRFDINALIGLKFHVSIKCLKRKKFITPRSIFITDSQEIILKDTVFFSPTKVFPESKLNNIVIGACSSCNASCIHCPTNKNLEGTNESGKVMDINIFKKIVDQISAYENFKGSIAFGLFNDSLLDPFLLERVKILKNKLPMAKISINTNCGIYDRIKHLDAIKIADSVLIQVSAFDVKKYEELMFPLKREKVFRNIHKLAKDVANHDISIDIAMPLSLSNKQQVELLRRFTKGLKTPIRSFGTLPFSNRCGDNLFYEELALLPQPGCCRGDALNDLIIDWDGSVLSCCQDFKKRNILGNLQKSSLTTILKSSKRKDFKNNLDQGLWNRNISCRNCKFDSIKIAKTTRYEKKSLQEYIQEYKGKIQEHKGKIQEHKGKVKNFLKNVFYALNKKES